MDASSVEGKHGGSTWWVTPIALIVLLVLAAMAFGYGRLLVAGPSGTSGAATEFSGSGVGASRTVQGNGVSLTLTWQGQKTEPIFSVAMDTHSGTLDGYDLARLAVLRTDSGQEVAPVSWDAPGGGHHRKGTLAFPSTGPDGTPLVTQGGGPVTVIVKDVAGVKERVFAWTP